VTPPLPLPLPLTFMGQPVVVEETDGPLTVQGRHAQMFVDHLAWLDRFECAASARFPR
jgi:hypothetical protein